MSVSYGYLAKIQRAVRIKTASADIQAELADIVEECRADLEALGVLPTRTRDEADHLILGAVRCFARWKMAYDADEAAANMGDYMTLRDELRRRVDYIGGASP